MQCSSKLVIKVIVNWLKPYMDSVISSPKSSFIPGKIIIDNIIITQELLHTMKYNLKGMKWKMAVKLDMSKAYNRVEWPYLEATLWDLGFQEQWIVLVMPCVTTVNYSILVNGRSGTTFTPSRGLRQVDLLSPYLFLFCAEGLSSMLSRVEHRGNIQGVATARGDNKISYLFFADNNIPFCNTSLLDWIKGKTILKNYERASRQMVNDQKSSLFFSTNTSTTTKVAVH